jgi:hypothetical protein
MVTMRAVVDGLANRADADDQSRGNWVPP